LSAKIVSLFGDRPQKPGGQSEQPDISEMQKNILLLLAYDGAFISDQGSPSEIRAGLKEKYGCELRLFDVVHEITFLVISGHLSVRGGLYYLTEAGRNFAEFLSHKRS